MNTSFIFSIFNVKKLLESSRSLLIKYIRYPLVLNSNNIIPRHLIIYYENAFISLNTNSI